MLGQIVTVEDAAAIVMVNCLVALCAPSVTRAVKVKVPVVVGVPVMAPLDLASKTPPANPAAEPPDASDQV